MGSALTTRTATAVVIALTVCSRAAAQKTGDLRDPQHSIFKAFPEADRYRTIPREIDDETRSAIEQRLPFKIHLDELGRHYFYVALRGLRPVGFLYCRVEETEFGLTEIIWSMTLDLRIAGFAFQRCRDKHKASIEESDLARVLHGRDVGGLIRLTKEEHKLMGLAAIPPGAEQLAATVLRSGLIAIVVADVVWRGEIERLQDLQMGVDAFPAGSSFRRFVRRASDKLHRQPDVPAFPSPTSPLPEAPVQEEEATLLVARAVFVRNGKGVSLGVVVRTEGKSGGSTMKLRWKLDARGRIVELSTLDSWPSASIRLECQRLSAGHTLASVPHTSPMHRLAAELDEVLAALGGGK